MTSLFRLSMLSTLFLILLLAGCGWFSEDDNYTPPDDDRPWVLVDIYHTDIQNPEDHWLHRDQYAYQGTYGFRQVFEHLERNDYPWSSFRTMPLSRERLQGYSILFINLIHNRNPDFTPEEVDLIIEFVENGGGLFVIADHTNVYRHAERINPFLIPMGIEVMYHTAVDFPPLYSISGRGWLITHDFADHPTTEGVEMISFKTGGPLDTEYGVAFSSERSFADYWDPEMDAGYYGDWQQTDPELEPSGPLNLAAAAEFGEGRVAVVGDQNIFGDGWLHVGHNFEFAMNIIEWLAGNEDTDTPLRLQPRAGHNIAMEARTNYYQAARTPNHGYYTAFIEANRNAHATTRITPSLETLNTDTLFFPSSDITFTSEYSHLNELEFEEDELDEIESFLRTGGQAVISFEANDIRHPTVQLLQRLAPDFEIHYGDDQVWVPGDEGSPDPDSPAGYFPISSPHLDVEDLVLGSRSFFPNIGDPDSNGPFYPEDYEDLPGYLFEVTSPWGEPFLDADIGGSTATIARRAVVGDGELIIFVQDGFFRNRTLGSNELLRPQASFRVNAIELLHHFIDYLSSATE